MNILKYNGHITTWQNKIVTSNADYYGGLYNYWAANYNTPAQNKNIYGGLYNYDAIMYNSGGASIAPPGWHVPSSSDYRTLLYYLDPSNTYEYYNPYGDSSSAQSLYAGTYLKEAGFDHWDNLNTGTNTSGFTAYAGGLRENYYGIYEALKIQPIFWATNKSTDRMVLVLYDGDSAAGVAGISSDWPHMGFSLRLIKDDSIDPGSITDYDGNTYNTVTIGTQVWTQSNLLVEHYNDGTPIPILTSNEDWTTTSSGAMCYYNGSVAPNGWHVPTVNDVSILLNYLDPSTSDGISPTAGSHLKEIGNIHWSNDNLTTADNTSGFSAIGSGFRAYYGLYLYLKYYYVMWTSDGYILLLISTVTVGNFEYILPLANYGCSIRFIKDDSTDPGSITDYDGNKYPTIKIGTQVWTTKNFTSTHYADGTVIPYLSNNTSWLNDASGAMCYYNNKIAQL